MSATYRQSSHVTPQLLEKDPDNRLLARGPRFRLSAEMIRDQALAISGLMVDQVGGPSVRPYQPAGLWDDVVYGNVPRFEQDHGDKLYRGSDSEKSDTEKLEWLFRITPSRRPSPDEIDLLVSTFQAALRRYVDHPELAEQLMTVGESSYDPRLSVTQLAALAAIANALLNTDEVITKN